MKTKNQPFQCRRSGLGILLAGALLIASCSSQNELRRFGQHYQEKKDHLSLEKVVNLMPDDADTSLVKAILGQPIDMGFDYRYLIDSLGPNNCVIGAVFHIDDQGRIDDKWIGEICE